MSEDPNDRPVEPVARPVRRLRWPLIVIGALIGVPAIVFATWALITLGYTYSQGNRAGYVQKLSKKGWLCKTWEGELSMVNVPGAAQERWLFTVRNDSIAGEIQKSMGSKVALTYDEHRGVPSSCFGDTPYFVTAVRRVQDQ